MEARQQESESEFDEAFDAVMAGGRDEKEEPLEVRALVGDCGKTLWQRERTQHFRFFSLPPEIRCMVYRQALLASNPLSLHASGLLKAPKRNRPNTAMMATCKQMWAEARPVLYEVNSFLVGKRAVLSHHLKATPRALRRLKCHTIKHVVLRGCNMLNITRLAELKRLRSLETLTIFESRFDRHTSPYDYLRYRIIFDVGSHTADAPNSDSASIQGEHINLVQLTKFLDNTYYKSTLRTMMVMRPNVKYQVVYLGAFDPWTIRSKYLVTFGVDWDPGAQRYVFLYEGLERDGCYL